jgi:pimeloyl-ACP methyl ester carboxylesterase
MHGAASNMSRWAEFGARTRLRESWDLLRLDLRGNGQSVLPRARVGMDVWCADLVRILDAEGYQRAVVGGHCLGANIALQFAARHPGRTAGLVLIEPMPPRALVATIKRLALLRPALVPLSAIIRALNSLGIYRRKLAPLDLQDWDRATRRGEVQLSWYASAFLDLRTTPLAAYFGMLAATTEPWPPASAIRVPSLALLSSRGSFTDPTLVRRALAALSACQIVELDTLHWIPTEQPDAMRAAIEDWLERRNA